VSVVLGGLRRLLAAPGLWLGCWLALVAIAWGVGVQVQIVAAATVGPFDALDLERVVFGVADVLQVHPALMSGIATAVTGGGLVSAIGWLVVSPLVIARLAGSKSAPELGAKALAGLPGVVVQSLWHAVLRALLIAVVLMSARPLPEWGVWVIVGAVWLAAGVALDATRVAVVEHGAAPWHVRTAWRGFVRVARRPRVLVAGVVLGGVQVGIGVGIVWISLAGLGSAGAWVPRVLALVSVGVGLWRVGIVVEDAAGVDDGA
jgi:hypothetical protein